MQPWIPADIVRTFTRTVRQLGMIPVFDWMGWKEGKTLIRDKDTDYTQLDTITLCKLITVIIRSDRFTDGFLIMRFHDGTVEKIIKGLKKNVENG